MTSDKVVVAAGEPIPRDIASILTRLEVFPFKVGIDFGLPMKMKLFTHLIEQQLMRKKP